MKWITQSGSSIYLRLSLLGCQPKPSICPPSTQTFFGMLPPFTTVDGQGHCVTECKWLRNVGAVVSTTYRPGTGVLKSYVNYGTFGVPWKTAHQALNACAACCCNAQHDARGPNTCGAAGSVYLEYELQG